MNTDIEQVMDEHSDMIFRLIYKIVPEREDALDLTQDLFARIFEKPEYLQNAESPRGYLLKSAWNLALNHQRNQRTRRMKEREHAAVGKSRARTPEDELAREERAQTVRRCLESLSPQQREAVLLRFYGDMKLDEIAGELRINAATVRVHLKRALEKMKILMFEGREGRL